MIAMLFLEFLKLNSGCMVIRAMVKSFVDAGSSVAKFRSPKRTIRSEKSLKNKVIFLKIWK